MFNKVQQGKQLLEMRKQAKELQKQLEKIEHTEEKDGMHIKVNGAQQVLYIEVDGEEQKKLVELINKAMKNVQKKSAQTMMEMGGGLSGLFGN